jgi:hypothetical protein
LNTFLLIGYLIKYIENFIDDMPTNDTYVSNIEHNNDGINGIYLKQEFGLNSYSATLNDEIYNPNMSKYLLIRVESLK